MTHGGAQTAGQGMLLSPIGTEALDDPSTDPALVRRMLTDIARANRWLGGAAAVRYGIGKLLTPEDRGATLTLVDIGTGAGDLPPRAAAVARKRGVTLRSIGLERTPVAARLAMHNGLPSIVGCAGSLPLRPGSVDIVLLSQVAHHLGRDATIDLFRASSAVARRGVLVADLRPGYFAAAGFCVAGAALAMHRITIRDGVTSLRRGYTVAALRSLCAGAGAGHASVVPFGIGRIVAWWRTDVDSPPSIG
ncbi:MAG TPA: methyltransferase domain-containing protein [Gemmatimonadales bacterium]